MGFRAAGVEPAEGFAGDGFVVRPLVPADNAVDYEAVMASREFLFHWEQDPPYPPEDFSVDDNLVDLEKMHAEHEAGSRYTYTVMSADESVALGCLYLLPPDDRLYRTAEVTTHDGTDMSLVDVLLSFWVRPSTWGDGFEAALLAAVLDWFADRWPFRFPVVVTNEHLTHQIASIESLGLKRRFDYDRPKDMYTSYIYG